MTEAAVTRMARVGLSERAAVLWVMEHVRGCLPPRVVGYGRYGPTGVHRSDVVGLAALKGAVAPSRFRCKAVPSPFTHCDVPLPNNNNPPEPAALGEFRSPPADFTRPFPPATWKRGSPRIGGGREGLPSPTPAPTPSQLCRIASLDTWPPLLCGIAPRQPIPTRTQTIVLGNCSWWRAS